MSLPAAGPASPGCQAARRFYPPHRLTAPTAAGAAE
jgi:hypothetical protein